MNLAPLPLSPREETVLYAMADGLENAEIAADLFISVQTVKFHVGHIFAKMGAHNRAHAVALAYHHGLLLPMGAAA